MLRLFRPLFLLLSRATDRQLTRMVERGFDAVRGEKGVRVQKVGPRAPNLKAVAQR
jgi:hypothetical protein